MSHHERGRGYRRNYSNKGPKHKPLSETKLLEGIDPNSAIIQSFRLFSIQLDDKHDRYERIVKLSRDITIESKRIIFLLHQIDDKSSDTKRESLLSEADTRLNQLISTNFKGVAEELRNEDPYQYLRAFTAGLQEFIEAVTFYQYLKNNYLENWKSLQDKFQFSDLNNDEKTDYQLVIPQTEFILGIADLTGELMRKCINSVGLGQVDSCFRTCAFVRDIHTGFLGIGNSGPKECSRKLMTLRQSLNKMESACYTIRVRGSEIPKHMLADVLSGSSEKLDDQDEGFF